MEVIGKARTRMNGGTNQMTDSLPANLPRFHGRRRVAHRLLTSYREVGSKRVPSEARLETTG
jgi:hypothetical protein